MVGPQLMIRPNNSLTVFFLANILTCQTGKTQVPLLASYGSGLLSCVSKLKTAATWKCKWKVSVTFFNHTCASPAGTCQNALKGPRRLTSNCPQTREPFAECLAFIETVCNSDGFWGRYVHSCIWSPVLFWFLPEPTDLSLHEQLQI